MIFADGFGNTIRGPLPRFDKWRLEYARSNPTDTDNGYYPQNIFRLVSRQRWYNFRQNLYFQVLNDNLSASNNRNESNGVLLFNRYQDGDNLYYTGVRVDGTAVIKKKLNGVYFTLAQTTVWTNGKNYDRKTNPDILPKNQWIGLESRLSTLPSGQVAIELWIDRRGRGNWEKILSAIDDGKNFGLMIDRDGYTGIRTDFMDVRFWRYEVIRS